MKFKRFKEIVLEALNELEEETGDEESLLHDSERSFSEWEGELNAYKTLTAEEDAEDTAEADEDDEDLSDFDDSFDGEDD